MSRRIRSSRLPTRVCEAVWSSSPPTIRRCTPPRTSRTIATTRRRPRFRCWSPRTRPRPRSTRSWPSTLSERFDTPVFLRTTTRISHATGPVPLGEVEPSAVPLGFVEEPAKWVMLPVNARKRHVVVEERMRALREFAESFDGNRIEWGDRSLGIITAGVAYQYVREAFPHASVLKLGMAHPLARASHPRVRRGGDAAGGGGRTGPDHRDPCEGDGDSGRREGPGADPGGAQPADRAAGDQRRSGAAARTRGRAQPSAESLRRLPAPEPLLSRSTSAG